VRSPFLQIGLDQLSPVCPDNPFGNDVLNPFDALFDLGFIGGGAILAQ